MKMWQGKLACIAYINLLAIIAYGFHDGSDPFIFAIVISGIIACVWSGHE